MRKIYNHTKPLEMIYSKYILDTIKIVKLVYIKVYYSFILSKHDKWKMFE